MGRLGLNLSNLVQDVSISDLFREYNRISNKKIGNRVLSVLQHGWYLTNYGTLVTEKGWRATDAGCSCPSGRWKDHDCKHQQARKIVLTLAKRKFDTVGKEFPIKSHKSNV